MTDASIHSIRHLNDCGCCEGLMVETPSRTYNRPGLSAIEYRVGAHPDFLNSMLARLSVSGLAPLRELRTREKDDFTIALLDGWATVADVLTFYQERLANENYLRTATERLSVLELARLIDYRLHPGVAASTYLAFTLDEPKGPTGTAALSSPEIITIDEKTKVQSTPGPGEEAQTFETVESIEARVEWNAIHPQQTEKQILGSGHQQAYLEGITLGLTKGDVLLFVSQVPVLSQDAISKAAVATGIQLDTFDIGEASSIANTAAIDARGQALTAAEAIEAAVGETDFDININTNTDADEDESHQNWNIRTVVSVEDPDPAANHTLVKWDEELGQVHNPKVYVFRKRASLFGHNAPDWRAMAETTKSAFLLDAGYDPEEDSDDLEADSTLDSVLGHDLSVDPRNDSEWPKFNIAYRSLADILASNPGLLNLDLADYEDAIEEVKAKKGILDAAEEEVRTKAAIATMADNRRTAAYTLYIEIRRLFRAYVDSFIGAVADFFGINPWGESLVTSRNAYLSARQAAELAKLVAAKAVEDRDNVKISFDQALDLAEDAANTVEKTIETAQKNLELKTLYLDSAYTEVMKDSWVLLTFKHSTEIEEPQEDSEESEETLEDSDAPAVTQLINIEEIIQGSQAQFTLSGKSTRLFLKKRIRWDFFYKLRETAVYVQSELLPLAPLPVTSRITGARINLNGRFFSLKEGHRLIVSGPEYGNASAVAAAESEVTRTRDLVDAETAQFSEMVADLEDFDPESDPEGYFALNQRIQIAEEEASRARAAADEAEIELSQARTTAEDILANDPNAPTPKMLAEVVTISEIKHEGKWAQLTVTPPLEGIYQRDKTVISGNVALATHGETVSEVLGSGDASQPFQEFELRQKPLTHIIDGQVVSTLEVRVDDLLWKEVPTLYGHGPNEHVFKTKSHDDGTVVVQFGDGLAGARLSTGQDNVRAVYRKGIGTPGLVRANQLNNLMSRPLGLKEAINPVPARDADDPERMENAQDNAPLTVMTLDRAVSLQDYADFARSFGGIHKAQAIRFVDGFGPGVFVTVAGTDGAVVEEGGELFKGLKSSFIKSGDPHVRFRMKSYRPAYFEISAKIKVHPDHIEDKVVAEAEAAVRKAFSFDKRELGQPVMWSEVIAVVQAVSGAVAVDLASLNRVGAPFDIENPNPNLPADSPSSENGWKSAEILMLNPDLQFFITVMQ